MSVLELCLLDGKEGIRGKMDEKDGLEKFACYDFINLVCGKSLKNVYGRNTFYNLIQDGSEFKDEIESLSYKLHFKGRGQRETPCATVHGLHTLLMVLGGKVAIAFRDKALRVLQRYLDGDTSLCKEIVENKEMGKKRSYAKFMTTVVESAQEKLEEELKEIPATAYIYATYSNAFPGLLKIGRSRDVRARLSSANTFMAPAPHKLLCMAPTFDAVRDEAMAHAHFARWRLEKSEFFEVEAKEVERYFETVITGWYHHELAGHLESNKGHLVS